MIPLQPAVRPFIFTNMAMTADGKVTSATLEPPKFSSETDRRTMDVLRASADAVLIGAGTLRADDPPMHIRDADLLAARAALGQPPGLWQIVVSRSLKINHEARFFRTPNCLGVIVATVEEADADGWSLSSLPSHTEVWRVGQGDVDLPLLLSRLHDRGIKRLLVEGGPQLNWHFVEHNLFDELNVTIVPAILGGQDAPTWVAGTGFRMADQQRLLLKEAKVVGSEIFCRYQVIR